MGSLASINIKFFADLKSFSSSMQNAEREIVKVGKNFEKVGIDMSTYLTAPLAGLGAIAVASAAKFETLETSLKSAFAGNEKASKAALKQITDFASKTPYQLEQVTSAFIKLKNLGLDPSERALTSYGNTASAMGKSLDQMVEAVADASTMEFERLKEFGIKAKQQGDNVSFTFRGVTTTVAKESDAIQKYLLNIGEVDFAGGMEAQSKTFAGRMSTLKDNVSLLSVEFGKIIIEAINPFIDKIGKLAESFKNLSPETKNTIVVIAALVAAIGPLVTVLGFIMTSIVPATILGFGLLKASVIALAGAIQSLTAFMLMNPMALMAAAVALLTYQFIRSAQEITPLVSKYQTLINLIKSGGNYLDFTNLQMRDHLQAVAEQNLQEQEINKAKAEQLAAQEEINKALENYKKGLTGVVAIEKELAAVKAKQGYTAGISGAKQYGGDYAKNNAYNVANFADAGSKAPVFGDLNTKPLIGFKEEVKGITEEIAVDFSNMAAGVATSMGEFVGALLSGTAGASDVGSFLLGTLGSVLTQLGQIAIQIGIGLKAIKTALKSLNPIVAIAAGVGLIALGAFFKNAASKTADSGGSKTRAFASGGIVYGPTMGLVGEYAGASSNPEVIAPLDKLKKLIQPQGQNVNIGLDGQFKMSGQDMLLVIERATNRKNRKG